MVQGIGILPSQYIRSLVESYSIKADKIDSLQIQPASFEPKLGPICYVINASRVPSLSDTISERIERKEYLYSEDLTQPGGAYIHPNTLVLVPLNEEFDLPQGYMGCSTAKSTLGRIGVLVRLLTENYGKYDTIPDGYKGKLYVELYSRYFPIRICKGLSVIQIVLAYKSFAQLEEGFLKLIHKKSPLLYDSNGIPIDDIETQDGKLMMHIDLPKKSSILRARNHVPEAIDLGRDFSSIDNKYQIDNFWMPIEVNSGVIAPPNALHLAITKEAISIPLNYVTLMGSFNPVFGRLNPHEAGLFNPGHGFGKGEGTGFRPVLEVTTFDLPHTLRDNDPICAIAFHKLIEPSDIDYDFKPFRAGQSGVDPGKFFKKL